MRILPDFSLSHLRELWFMILGQALFWAIVTFVVLTILVLSGGLFFLDHFYFFFDLWLRITILGIPIMTMALLSEFGFPPRIGRNRFGLFLNLLFIMICIPVILPTHQYLLLIVVPLAGSGLAVTLSFVWVIYLGGRVFQDMLELAPLPLLPTQSNYLVACHLTDVHMTTENQKTIEGYRGGEHNWGTALSTLSEQKPRYVFITGDFTDSGGETQWSKLLDALKMMKNSFVFIAPGNHDLNPAYSEEFSATAHSHGDALFLFRRFLKTLIQVNPTIMCFQRKLLSQVVRDFEEDTTRLFLPWRDPGRMAFYEDGWENLFPLFLDNDDDEVRVLVLNSVPKATSLGEGALGTFGEAQLDQLQELMDSTPSRRMIWILTHHAPFRRPNEKLRTLKQCWDCGLLSHRVGETRRLVEIITRFAALRPETQVFILCGHRHTAVAGQCGTVQVLEAGALVTIDTAGWEFYIHNNRAYVRDRVSDSSK
jgi:Calcineurin-like phosphoesterase